MQDFYELSKEKEVEEYKKIHNNCCGLGDQEKRIKNLKEKRKEKNFEKRRKIVKIALLNWKKNHRKDYRWRNDACKR